MSKSQAPSQIENQTPGNELIMQALVGEGVLTCMDGSPNLVAYADNLYDQVKKIDGELIP